MLRIPRLLLLSTVFVALSTYAEASSGVVVLAHPSKKGEISKKDVYDLYVGNLRTREVEVLEQTDGDARDMFYKKFLKKSQAEMKQQWSILVFSGNRAPKVLRDDKSVLDYILENENALGYVSTQFWEKMKKKMSDDKEDVPVELFSY